MDARHFIWFLIIGLLAGWFAGLIMKRKGFGFGGNLIIGVLGAIIGGFAFGLLGLSAHSLLGSLIMATAGAVLLLFLLNLAKK